MKKFFIAATAILFITGISQAQTTKDNTTEKHHRDAHSHHNRMKQFNVSEDQKKQFGEISERYRKQLTDLRNNKSLSAEEIKTKSMALRKEQHGQMQSLLTPEQKTQMAAERKDGRKGGKDHGRNFEQMKTRLGLSDEQAAKLKTNQQAFHEKVTAIRSDNTLTEIQKKEQVKALAKQHKENMKTLLTPEQFEKMKAGRKGKNSSK